MAITKRGGSWQASVIFNGKRHRYSFRDEHQAKVWEKEAELAVTKGTEPAAPSRSPASSVVVPGRTLNDLLTVTHQSRWASLKTNSMQMVAERVVRGLGEDLDVREVTHQVIVTWVWKLRTEGLSQSTINRRLSALSAMLETAVDLNWISSKPKVPFGKERKLERRYLTREEEESILKVLEGRREWAMCVVAVETGLRLGELVGLRWRNVQPDRLTVVETKNDSSRTVPLTKRAREVLEALPRVGAGPFDGIIKTEMSRRFRKAALEAGVVDRGVVFHSLRHTCASRLVMAGVDVRRVQVWMGHKTIQSTLVYAHLSASSLQDALPQLENFQRMYNPVCHSHDTCGKIGGVVS